MLTCTQCGTEVALPDDPSALSARCGECGTDVDLASMRTLVEPAGSTPAISEVLPAGSLLSGYRIESVLGKGGMALVYRGVQLSLNRPVAIKVLPRSLAANPAFVTRFHREAGALASLSHPNIINIIDRGVDREIYFFVMELVDGSDLHAWIERSRPEPPEVVRIVSRICDGLEYAHKRGVIHRDIKPGNILIDRDGNVKVTDFGIAHLAGGQDTGLMLTVAGAQMGTANYMAPEQRTSARDVDARADLYSVGVVLYEMLTGRLPFGAFEPASALNRGADPRLDALILRALKPEPRDRFGSARELADALAPFAAGRPATPPPPTGRVDLPAERTPTSAACPHCSHQNRADAKFCLECGKTLIESCPKCRKSFRAGAKFCDACGVNVTEYVTQLQEDLKRRLSSAEKLAKAGRLAEALTEAETILRTEAPEMEALRAKARKQQEAWRAAKEKQDAAFQEGQRFYDGTEFERAIEIWRKLPSGIDYVQEAVRGAEAKIRSRGEALAGAQGAQAAGRFEEALALWERARGLMADFEPYALMLEEARAKVAEGKYAEAAKRATHCATAQDFAGATAAWKEALQWKPGDESAGRQLKIVESKLTAGKREEILRKAEAARSSFRYADAIACWREVLRLEPANAALKAELERKIREAEEHNRIKKVVILGGIGAGGFLLVVILVIILAVTLGDKNDKKGSGASGSGGSSEEQKIKELFERTRRWSIAGDYRSLWGSECGASQEVWDRERLRRGFYQVSAFQFYAFSQRAYLAQARIDPTSIRWKSVDIRDSRAAVVYGSNQGERRIDMIKIDGTWWLNTGGG